jgi:integrase
MAKRRGRGEGSIFRRDDGIWCASIAIGYDALGKRRRRTVYAKTKGEVHHKLAQLHALASSGTLTEPTRLTLSAFLDHWLEKVQKPNLRATTYIRYRSLIKHHINPQLGGVRLSAIQPMSIQNLYAELESQGAKGRTRELVHAVLHKAFKQAMHWGYMIRNPTEAVERPRPKKKAIRYFTAEETQQFLAAAKADRLHALYVLAVTSGLRQGELLGLQWRDVDWDAGAVAVRRTIEDIGGKLQESEPKTEKGRRRVELPQLAIQALKVHRKAMFAEGHASNWIFCDGNGGLLRRSNFLRRSYQQVLKRAGTPCIRFHDLRHTAATLLLLQGVHPKVVQERLGHATIAITLDTYSHVLPSLQREAAAKLDSLLG